MKNFLFIFIFASALIFASCGASDETVNACADDMCKAMENYDPEDPMSGLDLLTAMSDILETEEYEDVTESQLYSAMKEKCPEGYEKLKELTDTAE